jgi:hypothetical protein
MRVGGYFGGANFAAMARAIWIFLAVMLGLYVWSHVTAGHEIGKKLQPFVDELFGVTPSERARKDKPSPGNPKAD